MPTTQEGNSLFDRIYGAWEDVRRRLESSTGSLCGNRIPYAVTGGNAVASWVASIDPAGIRGTPNVDLLINRSDLAWATSAMLGCGFTPAFDGVPHCFLDGPNCKPRSGIWFYFAGEPIGRHRTCVLPDLSDTVQRECRMRTGTMNVMGLRPLVEMKLSAFRTIDRVHLHDMINVGVIGADWLDRLPEQLTGRLQELLDDENERDYWRPAFDTDVS